MLELAVDTTSVSLMDGDDLKGTPKAVTAAIARRAQEIWGEDWIAPLVRKYCEIQQSRGDLKATPVNRRSQIVAVFEQGNTKLNTAIDLLECVNGELRIAWHDVRIEKF